MPDFVCPAVVFLRVLLLVALVGVARGEPDLAPGLVWQAAAGCPDADGVRTRIAQRLTAAQAAAVHGITVDIVLRHGEFVASVDLRGVTVANDIRTLRATSCDELTDAIAVIVARVAAQYIPEPMVVAEAVAPVVVHEPVATVTTSQVATPPPVHVWGGGMHLLAISGIGAVPAVGLGGELAGFVRHRDTFLELGWGQWVAGDVMQRPGGQADLSIGLETSVLRIGWGPERLPIRAWVGGEVGRMQARSVTVAEQTASWRAASMGLGVAWPISPHIRLIGSFEVLVPLSRARFTLDGNEAYRVSPLSNRAAVGLEIGWR